MTYNSKTLAHDPAPSIRGSFEPCPCVDQFECPWSKKLLENANELSNDHPTKRKSFQFIESKFCEVEMDYRAVECCDGTFSDMDDPDEAVTEEPIENLNKNEKEVDMRVKTIAICSPFIQVGDR